MDLREKVVLVTGSSSGIGRETAMEFARRGSIVVVTYCRHKKAGERTRRECLRHGPAELMHLDVRNNHSVSTIVRRITRRFGRLDILVNNAGVLSVAPLHRQSLRKIEQQICVNLLGLIRVTRAFLPLFHRKGAGVIVNVASGLGKDVYPEYSPYCGTKWGVRGFTKAMARELPKGVRIYCANPGLTATRMTGYEGADPASVAGIIVKAAEEKLGKRSGDDVDIWEYLDESS
jgi:NAD(P)-dependent dehydrogenase (short-subunit alcohol dehydrogenase family)